MGNRIVEEKERRGEERTGGGGEREKASFLMAPRRWRTTTHETLAGKNG